MHIIQHEKYDDLIKRLEDESDRLVSMLRSINYPEVIAKGNSIVPSLVSSVKDTTVKNYLTLIAIAEINSQALELIPEKTRLKIYCDALQKARPNNDWGLAGRYLSGASLDIIKIGRNAIPYLMPFLNDDAKVGIWGSKEATVNDNYQNRVCDFIYYLILHILHDEKFYGETPQERDQAINALKKSLSKKIK